MRNLLLSAALIGIAATGQAEPPAEIKAVTGSEVPERRTCRIVFPERPNDAPKKINLYDGSENHGVRLPSMNFSKVIELPLDEITIRMTSAEVTKPESIPSNAPQLTIEESVQNCYIFVSSDPSNPTLPLKMRLLNASDERLKPGDTLWVNLTGHHISATLGDEEMSVSPNGEAISGSPIPNSGYFRAEFNYRPDPEEKTYKFTEQQWWHDAENKHLGFVVNSGGRLPKIYFFRDFR